MNVEALGSKLAVNFLVNGTNKSIAIAISLTL